MTIVDDLKRSYEDMMAAIEGLDEGQVSKPKTLGEWSIRDVLLHIAMWEGEVIKALSLWRDGQKIDWAYVDGTKGIQAFNTFWKDNLSHLSAEQVLVLLIQTHSALVADVAGVSDDEWERRGGVPEWIPEITISHNRHHMEKILQYRAG